MTREEEKNTEDVWSVEGWNMISVLADLLPQRRLMIYGDVQLTHSCSSSVVHLQSWGAMRSSPSRLCPLSPLVKHRLCRKSLQRREAACNLKTVEVIWHLHRDELVMMRTRLNSTLKLVYWLSGNKAWCIDPLMVTGALPDRALDITDPVSREFKTSTVCGSSFLPVKDKKKIQI